MAKQTIKTKSRRRKTGGNSGYVQCNMCHGSGRVKNWRKKKKISLGYSGAFQGDCMDFSGSFNQEISDAVDECVNWLHAERNRKILKRSIIDGVCYEPLAEEFDLSTQAVKKIVYKWRGKVYRYLNL